MLNLLRQVETILPTRNLPQNFQLQVRTTLHQWNAFFFWVGTKITPRCRRGEWPLPNLYSTGWWLDEFSQSSHDATTKWTGVLCGKGCVPCRDSGKWGHLVCMFWFFTSDHCKPGQVLKRIFSVRNCRWFGENMTIVWCGIQIPLVNPNRETPRKPTIRNLSNSPPEMFGTYWEASKTLHLPGGRSHAHLIGLWP